MTCVGTAPGEISRCAAVRAAGGERSAGLWHEQHAQLVEVKHPEQLTRPAPSMLAFVRPGDRVVVSGRRLHLPIVATQVDECRRELDELAAQVGEPVHMRVSTITIA